MILSVDSSILILFGVITFFILSTELFGKVMGFSTVFSILAKVFSAGAKM